MKNEKNQLPSNYYVVYIDENYLSLYLVNKDYSDKLICSMKDYLIQCLNKDLFAIIDNEEFYEKLLSLGVNLYTKDNENCNNNLDVKFMSLIISKYINKNRNKILSLLNEIYDQWKV